MTQEERTELCGVLIDVVEDWLEERGFTPKDFRIVTSQESEGGIIVGSDYDRLAEGFANVIGIQKVTDNRAERLANDILDFVNAFGYDDKTFAETICRGHKTLQQSTMRLFIATISKMAEVEPDDRNSATIELAKVITKIAKDHPLPLI